MLDGFENYYPEKPQFIDEEKGSLSLNVFFLVLALLFSIFLFSENYLLTIYLLIVIIIHEIGHFIAMKILHFKDGKLLLFTFLSKLVKQKENFNSQRKKILIVLSGPLPGLIIGNVLLILYLQNHNELLLTFSVLFIGINLLSILPIDPLDGGRLFKTIFFPNNHKINLFFVLISSILIIFIGYITSFWIVCLFGFLMVFKVKNIQKNIYIYKDLESEKINFRKTYQALTNKEYWKIRSVFLTHNPKIKDLVSSDDELWENESLLTDQINRILMLDVKKDTNIFLKIFIILIISLSVILPIYIFYTHQEEFLNLIEGTNV